MPVEYHFELLLHLTGAILTVTATVWAVYLIPLAKRAATWVLLSSAFILLAAERVLELFAHRSVMTGLETCEVVSDILLIGMAIFLFWAHFLYTRHFLNANLRNAC